MKTKRKLVPISTVDCGTQGPGNGNVGLQNRGPGNRDVRLENLNVDIGSSKRRCIREPDTTVQHQSVSQIGQPSNAIRFPQTNRRQLPLSLHQSLIRILAPVCRLHKRLFTVLLGQIVDHQPWDHHQIIDLLGNVSTVSRRPNTERTP
ncbi:hypothetical protein Tco_1232026 [Tanacetum coccineum]